MMGQVPLEKQLNFWDGPRRLIAAFKDKRLSLLFLVWALSMGGYTLYIEFFTAFLKKALAFSAIDLSNLSIMVAVFYIIFQVCIVYPLAKKNIGEKNCEASLICIGHFNFHHGLLRNQT